LRASHTNPAAQVVISGELPSDPLLSSEPDIESARSAAGAQARAMNATNTTERAARRLTLDMT
jgi:hypothetical protein